MIIELHISLPKTSTYVKVRMLKLNGCIFELSMNIYLKSIIIFGINLAVV